MDNVTNTLVGLAVGELVHRSFPSEPDTEADRVRRRSFLSACALASNFPDLDLFLTPLIEAPLGNLLLHRGPTHTVLFAVPQALVLFGLLYAFWPRFRALFKVSRFARSGTAVSIAIGFALHLSMDYLNSYGIHPFYPFDPRWYYGDTLFIIEPFFWVACATPLARTIQRRWLRWSLLAAIFAGPIAFTAMGYLLWPSFIALVATGFFVGLLQATPSDRRRRPFVTACVLGMAFIAVQNLALVRSRVVVADNLRSKHEGRKILDSAMTSTPTNPFCWSFVSLEISGENSKQDYFITSGRLSLLPSILPVERCPSIMALPGVTVEPDSEVLITKEERGDLMELRRLAHQNCRVMGWLRFARLPMFAKEKAWDARYSMRANGENFTALDFKDEVNTNCSPLIPAWAPPRQDLLD